MSRENTALTPSRHLFQTPRAGRNVTQMSAEGSRGHGDTPAALIQRWEMEKGLCSYSCFNGEGGQVTEPTHPDPHQGNQSTTHIQPHLRSNRHPAGHSTGIRCGGLQSQYHVTATRCIGSQHHHIVTQLCGNTDTQHGSGAQSWSLAPPSHRRLCTRGKELLERGSYQKRCAAVLRPESPTSEPLFTPDAVFPTTVKQTRNALLCRRSSSETHLRMSWTHAYLFGVLAVLLALTLWQEAEAAAVSGPRDSAAPGDRPAALRRVFMQGADASHFLRRRSRRAVKSQVETDAEQRQVLAADERRRQFHEAKRARLESHAEEEGDEQDEKSRESTEQWREFHYDGMYPSHPYNPQAP
ncbi:unnamed protein product [Boreogadus saida]